MGIAEDWSDLMFDLSCLSKQVAKRRFKKSIKYDRFKVSFVKLNLTPSFLSRDTEATLSTESKKSFKSISGSDI